MAQLVLGSAVIAERPLINVETGLELTVTDFFIDDAGKSGFFGAPSITYKVIVVTDLPDIIKCMKDVRTSKHFPVDSVIHFTLSRSYSDFYRLRKELEKKICGTLVPVIPKKLTFGDALTSTTTATKVEARNRQVCLDKFMKWCASTPKIASSDILLKFIGWSRNVEIRQEDEKSPAEKQLTAALKKNEIKVKVRQQEVEEDLFDSKITDSAQATASQLFEETTAPKDDFFNKSMQESNFTSDDAFRSDEKGSRPLLFSSPLFEESTSTISQEPTTVDDEEKIGNTLISTDQDLEVDDDVSDVVSQLQQMKMSNKSSWKPKMRKDVMEPKEVDAKVTSVDNMADEDLLKYVMKNEVPEAELDLGF